MKVLLLSLPTGYGHHQTAASIMARLTQMGIPSHMIDICEYISPKIAEYVSKTYLISTKYVPKTYGKIYQKTENKEKGDYNQFIKIIGLLTLKKFQEYITEYAPDVLICTHVFSAQIVTVMRKKGMIHVPAIGIVTDFVTHPFWEDTQIDYYVTPSALLNNQMRKKGIPEEKILPYGIPIHEKFLKKQTKEEARDELGIAHKNTILVMTGSMGFGKVENRIRQLDALDGDFQILCVCGFNTKLKERLLLGHYQKDMHIYGFAKNVDVMMDASDCIVTKPGGLTTSESLAKGIVPILIDPIPGQEDRNAEFLVNNGIAIKTSSTFPIDEAIFQLFYDKTRIDKMQNQVRSFGKPYAARDLCDFIVEHYGQLPDKTL